MPFKHKQGGIKKIVYFYFIGPNISELTLSITQHSQTKTNTQNVKGIRTKASTSIHQEGSRQR